MKTIIAIALLALATVGILFDYSPARHATWVSYVAVAPLLVFVVIVLVGATRGSMNDRAN